MKLPTIVQGVQYSVEYSEISKEANYRKEKNVRAFTALCWRHDMCHETKLPWKRCGSLTVLYTFRLDSLSHSGNRAHALSVLKMDFSARGTNTCYLNEP